MMDLPVEVRPASEADVRAIAELLKIYSDRQIVLPRDEADIRAALPAFYAAFRGGKLCGCVALRDFGGGLQEVRSLAVHPDCQRGGVGRALVEACIAGLRKKGGAFRLFSLTYQQTFFERLGFVVTDRHAFPEKIWSDCAKCPKHAHCDEIAMVYEVKA